MNQLESFLESVIEFLQRRAGVFLVLVAALAVQIPHPAEVFHRLATSHWPAFALFAHAALFAIVVELAVLIFVVRGRKPLSWTFAGFSISMNVFYYYTPSWLIDPASVWPSMLQCVAVSALLPLAIAFYSHETAEHQAPAEQKPVKRVMRTVRTTHTDEQQEQYTVVQPEQLATNSDVQLPVAQDSVIDYTALTTEEKKAHFIALFKREPNLNKSAAAELFGIGRTTVYSWSREIEAV